jgi:hypothetical protein
MHTGLLFFFQEAFDMVSVVPRPPFSNSSNLKVLAHFTHGGRESSVLAMVKSYSLALRGLGTWFSELRKAVLLFPFPSLHVHFDG